ncbi:energy-coupled thiamine transporter ThiT [Aerococcaceae bacterium DSM 111020]|nr:energy-coupled thiamine transporter ThiT [Aerococcaceae bacterium DSM 111020]
MNKRTANLLMTMLIAMVLAIGLGMVPLHIPMGQQTIYLLLTLLPIIYLAFRYGPATSIVAGAITGLILGLIQRSLQDWMQIVLLDILPLLSAGLAGLFARNTHKTLNNHRYSSTYLNIWTGSLLAYLVYGVVKFWLIPFVMTVPTNPLAINQLSFWLSIVVSWVITAAIISLLAKWKPSAIIPPRSRYLSRKETSSLLND